MMKKLLVGLAIASVLTGVSCQTTPETASNTNANTVNAVSTTDGPDNSVITTTTENGVKTETRTFKDNPRVSKVVVTTRDGNRTVKVYSKSGEERELKSAPEKALDATGDAIADAAGFTKDKAGDVGDKSKNVGEKVGDKTKEGAGAVKDKSVDTAKTIAEKSTQGAKAVANKTKAGASKAGKVVKKIIP